MGPLWTEKDICNSGQLATTAFNNTLRVTPDRITPAMQSILATAKKRGVPQSSIILPARDSCSEPLKYSGAWQIHPAYLRAFITRPVGPKIQRILLWITTKLRKTWAVTGFKQPELTRLIVPWNNSAVQALQMWWCRWKSLSSPPTHPGINLQTLFMMQSDSVWDFCWLPSCFFSLRSPEYLDNL